MRELKFKLTLHVALSDGMGIEVWRGFSRHPQYTLRYLYEFPDYEEDAPKVLTVNGMKDIHNRPACEFINRSFEEMEIVK